MIDSLLAPFAYPFMQNAFLAGLLLALPAGLLSCFLVLKGWALMGDAVSHAILPGVVIAHLLGAPLLIGGFAAGMGCAVAVGFLSENSRVKRDTVMGVVFSGMFALGLVIYLASETVLHLDHILFGNMLGIATADLLRLLLIALPVTAVFVLKWRDFLLFSFDPVQARASGLRTGWLYYGLLALLSLTIVATLSSVGLVLAVGLMIAPGATAFLLTRRFGTMMLVSVAVALTGMIGGAYLSFFLDASPAATVILLMAAGFAAALVWRRRRIRRAVTGAEAAAGTA